MELTIREVINWMEGRKADPNADTVDKLILGDPDTPVTGVAVAFKATQEAVEEACKIGANLLVTHESIFYSHFADPALADNALSIERLQWLKDSGLAIYRNHDGIHRSHPDGITRGLVQRLGWTDHIVEERPEITVVELPNEGSTLADMTAHVKQQLDLPYVRQIGNKAASCTRIGLLVGYRGGGQLTIPFIEKWDLQLLIVGEGPEWEMPEYIRDAVHLGHNRALIVLGHAESEDAGMSELARQLEQFVAQRQAKQLEKAVAGEPEHAVRVTHIRAKPVFTLV